MNTRKEIIQWWLRNEAGLLGKARRYGLSEQTAEDLVQDVAVLVIRQGDRLDNEENFRNWTFRRLHWLILDHFRGSEAMQKAIREWNQKEFVAPVQEHQVILREILDLSHKLPGHQQQVLVETLNGTSDSVIAAKLGISQSTVRSLRRFARSRLVMLMAGKNVEK